MKKTDIAALAGAALFTAVALVGLVLGRDWKLLLVPLFLLPTIRFFAADSTTKEVVSGSAPGNRGDRPHGTLVFQAFGG